ncbi:hypothetical protein TNCV_2349801 [Trichonephila clavipes]|uniref:Uncharacterized protein n=1 Tax=Trichonephila clavipes TaxID=2585209 RepID=A0A8X6SS00_TRICX|nr:hypothetical protein TNCV_2349801 [Trichonephila clavipes]
MSSTFRLITEKSTLPFLWCPRLMFSVPYYPSFPAVCSQRDIPDWMLGVKLNLYKKALSLCRCLPGNSSSRRSSKVTSKLRSCCGLNAQIFEKSQVHLTVVITRSFFHLQLSHA